MDIVYIYFLEFLKPKITDLASKDISQGKGVRFRMCISMVIKALGRMGTNKK